MIKHASGIVEDQAVDLSHADDDLQGVAEGVGGGDEGCDDEAEGTPCELFPARESAKTPTKNVKGGVLDGKTLDLERRKLTAVTVSIQSTNGSLVKYLLSLNAYSFHNCPNKSCAPPIRI